MLRKAMVLALMAGGGALFALPAAPAAAATFNPVADSYVDASPANASRNYGGKFYVRADNSPKLTTYLQFNVSGFTAGSTSVLRFRTESKHRAGVEVRTVANNTWGEDTINATNAPPVGDVVTRSGGFASNQWISVDVSPAVTANGLVTLALTTTSNTALKITSREGANKPELVNGATAPPPPAAGAYTVTKTGTTLSSYQAASTARTFTGTLKSVVERAVGDLGAGGGKISFTAGTFDFGTDFFKLESVANLEFVGAGMDATILQNNTSVAADTEPFNFSGANRITIRDLAVAARGPVRNTSDAIDFDNASDNLVERVKIIASRGRGIIFDGKNAGFTAVRNTVRGCVITGLPSDGIELLASSNNRVEGCTITDVRGHGIQIAKSSSSTSGQKNKKSDENVITGNTIDNSGQDGINLNAGDRNEITNNTITNSANVRSSRDGIRIGTSDSISCNDNRVTGNTATDTQTSKTQKYGLYIQSPFCNRTVVGPGNDFAGNLTGPFRNSGTGTIMNQTF